MEQRKTKIIATIGPSSDSYEMLLSLAKSGLDVARINFSHGSHEEHLAKLENIERIYKEHNIIVSVMCDLKGPKIRTHNFEDGFIEFNKGDITRITMDRVLGNKEMFSVTYSGLYDDLIIGDKFSFDDGKLSFIVIDKEDNNILVCEALNDHYLKSNKGLNAPYVKLNNEYISKADEKDIAFLVKQNISYVAASFVRRKEDLLKLRELLDNHGRKDIKIVSKVESPEALDNIDEIIENSNAIMVARGDLGVEVEPEEVPLLQKLIINKCNIAGKPVIVATHMLESMQYSLSPTRAEVSDVANAILDGSDAVMLSAETATGKYPLESFLMQSRIAKKVENMLDYEKLASQFFEYSNKSQGDAIGIAVSTACLILDVKLVVMVANSLVAARKLAKFKIKSPIIVLINDKFEAQTLNGLYYGIKPLLSNTNLNYEEKEKIALKVARENGIKEGENIILVTDNEDIGKSDSMKVLQVR